MSNKACPRTPCKLILDQSISEKEIESEYCINIIQLNSRSIYTYGKSNLLHLATFRFREVCPIQHTGDEINNDNEHNTSDYNAAEETK